MRNYANLNIYSLCIAECSSIKTNADAMFKHKALIELRERLFSLHISVTYVSLQL